MEKTHHKLEQKFKWYKNWHRNGLHKFVHWFVLTVFVLAFLLNTSFAIYYTEIAKAASPWAIDTQAEWNAGTYTNTDATVGGSLELTSQATWYNRTAPTFYDSAYSYRRKITFDNSLYAENMTDFPVMLKLDNASLAWSGKIQPDMDDVVFRDADGSTLKWEWETKAPAGESIAWVKIPKIDASSSTDFIYMDYGNPSATDQSDAANVWTNNYGASFHLKESSGNISDSTSYSITGTAGGTPGYSTSGKIGSAISFSGDDYFNFGAPASMNTANCTVGFWAKSNDIPVATERTFDENKTNSGSLAFYLNTAPRGFFQYRLEGSEATIRDVAANVGFDYTQWHYFSLTYNGTQGLMYVDGNLQTDTDATAGSLDMDNFNGARIGSSTSSSQYYDGALDEVRYSSTARSANWIAAEYKNQGLNTYTSVGAEGTLDGFGWRRTITFDNSAQAENLANFPVMIKATNNELNWSSIVQADLDDVIFVDSDNTTLLNWEWEKKDSSSESIAWVKIPQIDASSSTDYIYMYYGSATAGDQSVVSSTWESNYHAAWHLNEASGVLYDSTSNDIDLTPTVNNPLYGQVGLIDGCLSWSGADIRVTKASDVPASNRYTVEAWVKPGTQVSTYGYMVDHASTDGNLSYGLLVNGSDLRPMAGHSNSGGSGVFVTGTNPLSTTSWTHLAATYDGANVKLYVNGVYDNQVALPTMYTANPGRVTVGGYVAGRYVGLIDEPVVSYVARSDKWIAAEYKNQGPNTFTTFGAPQNIDNYNYRRKITFDNSAQAENLVNFPAYVKADNASLSWNGKIQADLDDVIFVDADDTTPLSFGWEKADSSGISIAWVKVPQINASSNTDYIYMYYGNPSTTNHSHQQGVWSNGYEAVYHLNEASGTIYDSTKFSVNSSTIAGGPTYGSTGKIATAIYLDNVDDTLSFGDGSQLNFGQNSFTISFWLSATNYGGDGWTTYITKYAWDAPNEMYEYLRLGSLVRSNGTFYLNGNGAIQNSSNWYLYNMVVDRSSDKLIAYRNGTHIGADTDISALTDDMRNNSVMQVNPSKHGAGRFAGTIDELRFSSTARSANWNAAEYLNQTDSFNTIDSEITNYNTTGTYSSAVKDMAFNTNLSLFTALETLGTGTATYSVRTGPVAVPDGSWTGWVAVTSGSDPSAILDNNRYAQMKVDLTGDGATTPSIDSITLSYASVPGTSSITALKKGADTMTPPYQSGPGNFTLEGTANSNSGAAINKVEVSTDGGATWSTALSGGWSDAPVYNNWQYRQKITIDHTKVQGTNADFPVLIKITDQNNTMFGQSQTDGDDILFTDDNKTTKLSHEIEKYNTTPGSRELDAWVKIPSLSSGANKDIYMYYGNPSCGSQQDQANVWNSDYKGVWHLNETSGTVYDATINNNDSSAIGGAPTYGSAGKSDGAINFNGTTDYINIAHNSSIDFEYTDSFSLETWVKRAATGSDDFVIAKERNSGTYRGYYYLITGSDNKFCGVLQNDAVPWPNAPYVDVCGNNTIDTNWHHIVMTYNGNGLASGIELYVDGQVQTKTVIRDALSGTIKNTVPLEFAGRESGGVPYGGALDEPRVSSSVRSADWIKTEYNNQNSPSTFASFATEQKRGEVEAGGTTWSYAFNKAVTGDYGILTRVTNEDNVVETPGVGITLHIDADKPVSAIGYPATGGYYSPNLLATGTSSDTGGGIVANLDIRITKQGTGVVKDWTAVTNTGVNYSTWSYSQDGLLEDDQTYIIETRATDNFGNIQTTFGSSTITVDLTYPSSAVTSPKLNDKFKIEDRSINGTATTNNGQALSKVEVRILKLTDPNLKTTADTAGKTVVSNWTDVSGTANWSFTIFASLFQAYGGGYFQIQSRATNVVNLVESPSPGITVLIDDQPPTIPINLILQDVTNYSEGINSLFLQFDSSRDNETYVKEYEIVLNGRTSKLQIPASNQAQISNEKNISLVLTSEQGVKEGVNNVSVKAKDEVDNTSDLSKQALVEITKGKADINDIEIKNISLTKKVENEERTSAIVKYKTSIPTSTLVLVSDREPNRDNSTYYSDYSLDYNHTAILSDLSTDTDYKVKIEGIDQFGNSISSSTQSFRSTPKSQNRSILQIIAQALEDLFSWVQKVMAAPFQEKKDLDADTKDYLALKTVDTTEEIPSGNNQKSGTTKTPQVALSFRKNSVPAKENVPLTGNALKNIFNTNLQTQTLKANIIEQSEGVALDKNAEVGKKVTYKLDKIDKSEKVLVPGAEGELIPEIKDIETKEIIITEEKAEYLLIFKTDIPSKAQVTVSNKQFAEDNLNLSHAFYLDNLTPGETIKSSIIAENSSGKKSEAKEQSFTVSKPETHKSLWQIIVDALISAFDWVKNLLK